MSYILLEDALIDFPFVEVDDTDYDKIIHGQVLPKHSILNEGHTDCLHEKQ